MSACRRLATHYHKLAANYLALIQLAQYGCGCTLMSSLPRLLDQGPSLALLRTCCHVRDEVGF